MLNITSRSLTLIMGFILLFLQYEIFFGSGGIMKIWKLKQSIHNIQNQNSELEEKNAVLAADVEDLKTGDEAVEERARMDLGMVKKGEIFYQIIN